MCRTKRRVSAEDNTMQKIIKRDLSIPFPKDVWSIILGFLDNSELYRFIRVCKEWYNVAENYIDPTADLKNNVLKTYTVHNCLDCLKSIFNNPRVKDNNTIKTQILSYQNQDNVLYHACIGRKTEWVKFILENTKECVVSLSHICPKPLYQSSYDIVMLLLEDNRIPIVCIMTCLECMGMYRSKHAKDALIKYGSNLSSNYKSEILSAIAIDAEDDVIKVALEWPDVDIVYHGSRVLEALIRRGNLELLDMVLKDSRVVNNYKCRKMVKGSTSKNGAVVERLTKAGFKVDLISL